MEDVGHLAANLVETRHAAGTVLLQAGETPTRVYFVRSGIVQLALTAGPRRTVVHAVGPGGVLGDTALLARESQPFEARTVGDCLTLSVGVWCLAELLSHRPPLAQLWLMSQAHRIAALQVRLAGLLTAGLEIQVASHLVAWSDGGIVRFSQSTIADLLGVTRQSVNRVLKRFEAQGLIHVGYREVELLDPSALTRLVVGRSRVPASSPVR